jgi:MFS family permease
MEDSDGHHDDGCRGGALDVDGIVPADDTVPTGSGPITTSLVWATWALFVGLGLLLSGAGLFATVVGIRVETDGFPTVAIGLIAAAYYLGFLVGSRLTLMALGTVGHIRVYAALASVLAAVILTAGMVVHPAAWLLLRLLAGACLAGHYVVAESWLNQLATNANRARILSIYTLVTVVAYGIGQVSIGLVDPTTLTAFGIAAVLISVAVAPVALSEDAAPPILAVPARMPLRELIALVPTGVVTSVLVGIAHGAFIGLAAVYATRSGLGKTEIGVFVAMPTLGSLLLQVPISSASDEADRRIVGALTAIAAAGAATVLLLAGPDAWVGFVAMAAIGGATYPLYSIAGAYTNDWVPTEQLTAAASQLVVLYGAGAFVGPFLASIVMGVVGDDGFVWTTIAAHVVIALYLTARVVQWRPSVRAKPWNAVALETRAFQPPATAVGMGRRLRVQRRRPRRDPER